MIVFNLKCEFCNQDFEGWFDNTNDFNRQKKRKQINCPSCNSDKITKALMAPNLTRKSNSKNKKIKKTLASNLSKLKKIVEDNFDYVGSNFTEEAKRIKYGESKDRSIYGEATLEQTRELINEDIEVMPLPFSSKKSN